MARILIASPAAGLGHFHPFVGIVRHLKALGHQVGWTLESHYQSIEASTLGADKVPLVVAARPFGPPESPASLVDEQRALRLMRARFEEQLTSRLPPLREAIRSYRPTLMVCDTGSFVANAAASLEQLPFVSIGVTLHALGEGTFQYPYLRLARELRADCEAALARSGARGALGVHEVRSPYSTLVLAPATFAQWERPLPDKTKLVGASLWLEGRDDARGFPWDSLLPRKRLIYIAHGSAFTDARPDLIPAVIRAAAGLDAQLVVQTPAAAALSREPGFGHVVFVRSAPQPQLLQRAAVFVTHAGLSSALEGAHCGVPMLATPIFADQPLNAHLLATAGAAIHLEPDALSIESCREALVALLDDPAYRSAAARLSQAVRAEDGARAAAEEISAFAAAL